MGKGEAQNAAIKLEDVAVVRGSTLILHDFNMNIARNETIWLRGVNGSGKSTLLRVCAGLLPIAGGICEITGGVALCDENLAMDKNARLEHAIDFWRQLDGGSPVQTENALAAFDLVSLAEVPVRYLSTGQRKRAALARVVASGQPVWLLDEPYNGLDNASALRLDQAIIAHVASGGLALIAAHQTPSIPISKSISLDTGRAVK